MNMGLKYKDIFTAIYIFNGLSNSGHFKGFLGMLFELPYSPLGETND